MRTRHKTRKGKPGIDRLGKLIDFLLTHMPRASATKACILYIIRSKRKRLSNGFVRTDRSARQAAVKISQAAHIGKDRIVASRESVVWLQCFEPRWHQPCSLQSIHRLYTEKRATGLSAQDTQKQMRDKAYSRLCLTANVGAIGRRSVRCRKYLTMKAVDNY